METKRLKDLQIGDSIELGRYTATLIEKTGFNTGIFAMDQLLDKSYPRAGFRSRQDFMNIIRIEPDFCPIASKVTNARLPYLDEVFPNPDHLEKQLKYFRNTKNRLANHRYLSAWPEKNLLMDFNDPTGDAVCVDPKDVQPHKIDKFQLAGVRLLLWVEMI